MLTDSPVVGGYILVPLRAGTAPILPRTCFLPSSRFFVVVLFRSLFCDRGGDFTKNINSCENITILNITTRLNFQ